MINLKSKAGQVIQSSPDWLNKFHKYLNNCRGNDSHRIPQLSRNYNLQTNFTNVLNNCRGMNPTITKEFQPTQRNKVALNNILNNCRVYPTTIKEPPPI